MVVKECNSRAGVYKVQTFGTTHSALSIGKYLAQVLRCFIANVFDVKLELNHEYRLK
jgi:hypothetical protein